MRKMFISVDDDGYYHVEEELIMCKDCKYYRADGDCWHEWDNDGRIYYQSIINEPIQGNAQVRSRESGIQEDCRRYYGDNV